MSEKRSNVIEDTAGREMVIVRTIDAPRELVFAAFCDPRHLARWWGPRGFTTTTYSMEMKVGGVWRYVMHGPDGQDYHNRVDYEEIITPERIAFVHSGEEEAESMCHRTVVTFEADGNATKVTLIGLFKSIDERDRAVKEFGVLEGGKQTLARLEEFMLNGAVAEEETQFVITRQFNAAREVVFNAWTQAEHLAKWWGPKGFEMGVHEIDLRPGGVFHYSMKANGMEMWGKFVYREITRPEKLVFVVSFSDPAGNITRHPFSATWPLETLNMTTFSEYQGKTTLTLRGEPINASDEERKTFLEGRPSMRQGFKGTLDQLDEYLGSL